MACRTTNKSVTLEKKHLANGYNKTRKIRVGPLNTAMFTDLTPTLLHKWSLNMALQAPQ